MFLEMKAIYTFLCKGLPASNWDTFDAFIIEFWIG